jgi:heme/copper-type cytochrome/quinol oxidase subunit 2
MLQLPSGALGAVLVVASVCCVVAQAAILTTVRTVASAPVTPDKRPSTKLETAWAVLPAIALVAILVTAWRQHLTVRAASAPVTAAALAVPAAAVPRASR